MHSTTFITALLAQGMAVSAATMTVTVAANNKFTFTPNSITAQPGDTVAFNFVSQNHSVASSDANTPCQPQRNAIFSGFQPIPGNPNGNANGGGNAGNAGNGANGKANGNRKNTRQNNNNPTFMVPITSTQPMYIYCSQAQHCQSGMVMVINPPNANAVQQYAQKAAQAKNNVSPNGGVSGGQVINNKAGTTPQSVLGANAGDAAKAAKNANGKGNANGGNNGKTNANGAKANANGGNNAKANANGGNKANGNANANGKANANGNANANGKANANGNANAKANGNGNGNQKKNNRRWQA